MPSEFSLPNLHVQADTIRFYQMLIDQETILTVEEICDHGLPWISYDEKRCSGEVINHSLAVNDDSWDLL